MGAVTTTLGSPPRLPAWQASLFANDDAHVGAGAAEIHAPLSTLRRTWLDSESWVDHAPNWLAGADDVFTRLAAGLAWRRREVVMYQRLLPEPRLTWWWDSLGGTAEPLPVLARVREALTQHYGKPFDSIGCNLYRDGRDSVAWHADRERFHLADATVVIVSLGAARPFQLRPAQGGASTTWRLGHGDLLVMGGACQHDWQHRVPKVARPTGPRLSVMFRHHLAGWNPYDG